MSDRKAAARRPAVFVDRWRWLWLLAAAPLLLFPSPARALALLVIPGLWLLAGLAGRPALPRTPFNGALLLMGGMLLVSLYATYDLAVSLPKVAGVVLGYGLFFALAELPSPRAWRLGLAGLVAAGFSLAVVGLLGARWLDKFPILSRLTGLLPAALRGLPGAEEGFQPNEVAGSLLWIVPLGLVLAAHAWRRRDWLRAELGRRGAAAWQIGVALAAAVTCGVLLLTQSRMALLGLGLTLAGFGAAWLPRRLGRWGWVVLAVGLLAGLTSLTLGRWAILAQLQQADLIDPESLAAGSLEGRVEIWSRALDTIRLAPFTGLGLNTWRYLVRHLFPFWLSTPEFPIAHAHNEMLQAALDLGLPGLAAFVWLQAAALRLAWQVARRPAGSPAWPEHLQRAAALGLAAGLLAHAIFGLADAVALGAKPGLFFWAVLGLLASLGRLTRTDA